MCSVEVPCLMPFTQLLTDDDDNPDDEVGWSKICVQFVL